MIIEKKFVIAAVGIAVAIVVIITIVRRRNRFDVRLATYNGKHKDDPKIKEFQKRFPGMVEKAVNKIVKETGFKRPPLRVTFTLDDEFDADPFLSPSAGMGCQKIPFLPRNGENCNSYDIRLGSQNIVDGFKGRTKVDKTIVHELTHVFMYYYIPDMDNKPEYFIEGWPIHIAGQEKEIRRTIRNNDEDADNEYEYKDGEIHVDSYDKIMDGFHEHFDECKSMLNMA